MSIHIQRTQRLNNVTYAEITIWHPVNITHNLQLVLDVFHQTILLLAITSNQKANVIGVLIGILTKMKENVNVVQTAKLPHQMVWSANKF